MQHFFDIASCIFKLNVLTVRISWYPFRAVNWIHQIGAQFHMCKWRSTACHKTIFLDNMIIAFIEFRFCISFVTLYSYLWYLHSLLLPYISQLSCCFCIHCRWLIFWDIKTFLVDLMTRLSYSMICQLVECCWVTATKIMNSLFLVMNPSFFF